MEVIDFSQVEEQKENSFTPFGVIDVFDIVDATVGSSKNKGTQFLQIDAKRKSDGFSEQFYITQKALPRLKSLLKAVDAPEKVTIEQMKAALVGKKLAFKTVPRFDEANGRVYTGLPYMGFCKKPSQMSELAFSETEKEEIERGKKMIASNAKVHPDTDSPAKVAATKSTDMF